MIVLDTSFLIDFFRGKEETLEIIKSDAATTVIAYHEILSGIKYRKARKEKKFFRKFFSEIKILDLKAAEKSSEIMARLLKVGKSVNALDVLIAGIALVNGAEYIATRDEDFMEISKISELEVLVY